MADWQTLSFILTAVGYLLVLVSLSGAGRDLHGMNGAVEALEILGFLLYTAAFTLTAMVHFGRLDYNEPVMISHITVTYASVVFIIVGLGLYGGKVSRSPPAYVTTILVTGALLAALAGTFALLEVLDV